jgi:alanine racemase
MSFRPYAPMMQNARERSWVEVSAGALRRNYRRIQESVGPGVRVIPMVKADAYGLGMQGAVAALEPLDPWGYGVAAVQEGLALRATGLTRPVGVFSPAPPGDYPRAVQGDLALSISDLKALERLSGVALESGLPGRFHLEVDTGMGRAGFDWRRVGEWAPALRDLLDPHLRWEGVFTHFHSADVDDPGPTTQQWERFREALEALGPLPEGCMVHTCNSPGALRLPAFAADAVRPGIFLYGGIAGDGLPTPAPVASVRARIVFVREAPPGSTVGYNSTYRARGHELWATASIGYGDGLPRILSNRGSALVRGRKVPIIGRISMDVTVLDVTSVPEVVPGEVATFMGSDGSGSITVDEVAGQAGTISHEILTGLTARLPRIWVEEQQG